MTKGKAWLIWGLVLVVVVVGCFLSRDTAKEHGNVYYQGRVMFESNAEYAEFKRTIVDTDARICSMMILSSTPPIIADFSVITDAGCDFGYGKPYVVPHGGFMFLCTILLIGFFVSALVIHNNM